MKKIVVLVLGAVLSFGAFASIPKQSVEDQQTSSNVEECNLYSRFAAHIGQEKVAGFTIEEEKVKNFNLYQEGKYGIEMFNFVDMLIQGVYEYNPKSDDDVAHLQKDSFDTCMKVRQSRKD